jgi:hypothetical protein
MLDYDQEPLLASLERYFPEIRKAFPRFVNLEILDSAPSGTESRILQVKVGTAGQRSVCYRYNTEDDQGEFYISSQSRSARRTSNATRSSR